ncbi:MAG: hypothetical protein AB1394_13680 [Bacteroidota bacterium]
MNIEVLADRVKQLIDVTEKLLNYSLELKYLSNKYRPQEPLKYAEYLNSEIPSMSRFLHAMFFLDALLNITSLLHLSEKNPDKKEQSFYELAELVSVVTKKNDIIVELDKIRSSFETGNLHKFRHKIAAHKDIECAGDITIMYMNFVKQEATDLCIDITTKMKELLYKHFNIYCNNLFGQLHDKGFAKMYELFENELEKTTNENI